MPCHPGYALACPFLFGLSQHRSGYFTQRKVERRGELLPAIARPLRSLFANLLSLREGSYELRGEDFVFPEQPQ